MELGLGNTLLTGDPRLVDHIVGEVKSQGIFDQFRKECIADVDTKPAYQNLRTRVESSVNSFLGKQTWKADLNKNQLRETLRKHIHDASYLDAGVERIVDQVVNPKVYSVFMPQIEDVVYKFLGLERPKNRDKNGSSGFKDLLPKDLDPVSPESDKNSLKDVSLDSIDAIVADTDIKEKETSVTSGELNQNIENDNEKDNAKNGHSIDDEEKSTDEIFKSTNAIVSNTNLNNSAKSEEKCEEEEEDSPMFEPIDIMNMNESNISNDSHMSGISELTSHRSRSPDYSNEVSRDNMDFSNQDSQFSKVSSDSRLSIVTDFGSSNHGSTSLSDTLKDEREKNEPKNAKDNFKAVREFESGKSKDGRLSYDSNASKENTTAMSDSKSFRQSLSSKDTSRDGTEIGTSKDSRDFKDKIRDGETSKSKNSKDRNEARDGKREKDRDKEMRRRQNNRADLKNDKSSKSKVKEKSDIVREGGDRSKDSSGKPKEDKTKDNEIKENNTAKEGKDLKDIYKEKIRELREKKELTEKEKMSKDSKDAKFNKETKEKRDSSRDKRDSKDYKSSSSKNYNSSRSDNKTSKSSDKETKGTRNESKEKGKRDERRYSKDHKSKSNSSEFGEKIDGKRTSRSDKDDKTEIKQELKIGTQKSIGKRDSRGESHNKSVESRRDSKGEIDAKDKKRRDDKKGKTKDDHSSLRKNSDDRRSTDRDGSNGSNGKSSQKSNSSSGSSSAKTVSSSLSKESTNTSNSSSETSDSIEESQNEKLKISIDSKNSYNTKISRQNDFNSYSDGDSIAMRLNLGQNEISLPIKKRPLLSDSNNSTTGDIFIKKPKFAKNFQEAKRLMKIRRKMEKRILKVQLEMEKNVEPSSSDETLPTVVKNDVQSVPDEERVQIIEVCDEEYDEPYPEIQSDFTLEERSQIILGGNSLFTNDLTATQFNSKSNLSEMELSIRQSLNEMISDKKVEESTHVPKNAQTSSETDPEIKVKESFDRQEESSNSTIIEEKTSPNVVEQSVENVTESESKPIIVRSPIHFGIEENEMRNVHDDNSTNVYENFHKTENIEKSENLKNTEIGHSVSAEFSESNLKVTIEIDEQDTKVVESTLDVEPSKMEIVSSRKTEVTVKSEERKCPENVEFCDTTKDQKEKGEESPEKAEICDIKTQDKKEQRKNSIESAEEYDIDTEVKTEKAEESSKFLQNCDIKKKDKKEQRKSSTESAEVCDIDTEVKTEKEEETSKALKICDIKKKETKEQRKSSTESAEVCDITMEVKTEKEEKSSKALQICDIKKETKEHRKSSTESAEVCDIDTEVKTKKEEESSKALQICDTKKKEKKEQRKKSTESAEVCDADREDKTEKEEESSKALQICDIKKKDKREQRKRSTENAEICDVDTEGKTEKEEESSKIPNICDIKKNKKEQRKKSTESEDVCDIDKESKMGKEEESSKTVEICNIKKKDKKEQRKKSTESVELCNINTQVKMKKGEKSSKAVDVCDVKNKDKKEQRKRSTEIAELCDINTKVKTKKGEESSKTVEICDIKKRDEKEQRKKSTESVENCEIKRKDKTQKQKKGSEDDDSSKIKTSKIKMETASSSGIQAIEGCSSYSSDDEPCLYLIEDNERLNRFTKFIKSLEMEKSSTSEQIVETLTEEIASSTSKTMAPPQPKRKYSTSPLTDIMLNSTNNNNDAHKIVASVPEVEDTTNIIKKRKIGRPKKQRTNVNLCNQQNLLNGENFVMPLSPESDVSATSEKIPSNPLKDEKSRPRGSNQRYTSDDLYKPRPLFSSSSRRSRRSNQA